ncbi:MAG: hypothetical protein KC621_22000 [Myxococcales bacterium]|nr:hypothetical protein [Myxococcales bacterium]
MPFSIVVWLAGTASAIQCSDPITPIELEETVHAAEEAWIDIDDQAFRDHLHAIAGVLLPCVAHTVDPAVAARIHLLMALQLQAAGDAENAMASARAARAVAPDWVPPADVLSADDPLRTAWTEPLPDAGTRRVPEPKVGSVAFDGTNTRSRAVERPTIVQLFDPTGLAATTSYLGVGEPMPAYAAIPRKRNTLIACAAGAGGAGALTYGLAWGARSSMYGLAASSTASEDQLDGKRATTNLLSVFSTTLIAGAAGCGVGAAVIGQR